MNVKIFLICCLLISVFIQTVVALRPAAIYIFGDSLSDVGYEDNLPAVAAEVGLIWPVGKAPTYTSAPFGVGTAYPESGKMYSNFLADYYNLPALNITNNRNYPAG